MASENQNELSWLAFAYVAGELSAADAEAFELRLAEDQAAREAVAQAVELTQVVAAVESHAAEPVVVVRRESAAWSTRLAWMAVGGLASLLIALLWSGIDQPQPRVKRDEPAKPQSSPQARELALAWSQTRAALAESDVGLWYPTHLATADAADAAADDADDADALAEAPSWMTAGVLSLAGKSPEDLLEPDGAEPFSGERGDN
jgi:hypothetical protein